MGGYTHMSVLDVEDSAEKFGFGDTHESRFAHGALEAEATGFSLHRFKPKRSRSATATTRRRRSTSSSRAPAGQARRRHSGAASEEAVRVAPGVMRQFEAGAEGSRSSRSGRGTPRTAARSSRAGGARPPAARRRSLQRRLAAAREGADARGGRRAAASGARLDLPLAQGAGVRTEEPGARRVVRGPTQWSASESPHFATRRSVWRSSRPTPTTWRSSTSRSPTRPLPARIGSAAPMARRSATNNSLVRRARR